MKGGLRDWLLRVVGALDQRMERRRDLALRRRWKEETFVKPKTVKQQEALARQAAAATRSARMQLAKLDWRLGAAMGAAKERAKLQKKLGGEQNG